MRYLKGTIDYALRYDANQKVNLQGYVDSDWVGSALDRKSTSGCCFSMGSGVISWFSRKQSCVALSTNEAEYVAAYSTSYEVVWIRKLLSDLFDLQLDATCIYCNNQSCVKLSENPVFHDKSKHIEIKFHYIKDMVERGAVKLKYVEMEKKIVNGLTKPLAKVKFEYFIEILCVIQNETPRKREF